MKKYDAELVAISNDIKDGGIKFNPTSVGGQKFVTRLEVSKTVRNQNGTTKLVVLKYTFSNGDTLEKKITNEMFISVLEQVRYIEYETPHRAVEDKSWSRHF